MKRSMTYKAILSVGGLVVLFAYQNCGKVTSGLLIEDKGLAQGQMVDGMPVDPTTVDTGGVPDQPGTTPIKAGPGMQPGAPGSPTTGPGSQPTPIETCIMRPLPEISVAVKANSQKCDKKTDDRAPAIAAAAQLPSVDPVSGIKYCPVTQTNPIPEIADPIEIQDAEVAEAVTYCRQANKARVAPTLNLSHYQGQWVATVENVGSISDFTGNLVLRAASIHSSIGSLSAIHANNKFKSSRTIVICGFNSVANISDVNGHVILVDAHVGSMSHIRGSLSLVNSIIDNLSDTANSEINNYDY